MSDLLTVSLKQFLYGSGQYLSVSGYNKGDKLVSPTHRPPLLPTKYSRYSFLLVAESTSRDIVRPERLFQWNITMTPSGIKPTTFWLLPQCLNKLHHRVPRQIYYHMLN